MFQIISGAVSIPDTSNQLAEVKSTPFNFSTPVLEAHVALSGFRAEYKGTDHHVQELLVTTKTEISNPINQRSGSVTVTGDLWLRDKNADDVYNGSIYFTLFVKTAPAFPVENY